MWIVKYLGGVALTIIGLILLVSIILNGALGVFASIAECEALQRLVIYAITIALVVGGPYFAIRGFEESI